MSIFEYGEVILENELGDENPVGVTEWTPWMAIFKKVDGSIDAFYRRKGKKVEVKMLDKKNSDKSFIKAEASCNLPANDEFNLYFGISLAYERCKVKYLKRERAEHTRLLHQIENELKDSNRYISQMINSLPEEGVK